MFAWNSFYIEVSEEIQEKFCFKWVQNMCLNNVWIMSHNIKKLQLCTFLLRLVHFTAFNYFNLNWLLFLSCSKLKNTVSTTVSQLSGVLPGNPVTREFEATRHIASAGPGLLWKVYEGHKKSLGGSNICSGEKGFRKIFSARAWLNFG